MMMIIIIMTTSASIFTTRRRRKAHKVSSRQRLYGQPASCRVTGSAEHRSSNSVPICGNTLHSFEIGR